MQYITIFDYLLLPVYLYFFYFIVKKQSVKYTDANLRKYFFMAFWLHMFGAIAYALMVQYYYGYGDSFIFYYGSDFLSSHLTQNPANIKYFFMPAPDVKNWYNFEVGDLNYAGYLGIESNLFIMKISALVSFLSFNKYLIITLFFGFFAFAGLWRLFLVFYHINKEKQLKILAVVILYMPSVWFWGSGLIKDSVCIGAVGFIVHFLYKNFVKKEFSIRDIIVMAALIYAVTVIKSYITIVLVIGLVTFIFYKFVTPFKNILIRGFIIIVFIFAVVITAFTTNFTDQLQLLAEESKVQVDAFQRNYLNTQQADEGSLAALKTLEIDATLGGLIRRSPIAVFNCLFRPYIWESKKIFILLSSLESMFLLFCTLYLLLKLKFFGVFRELFNNPFILVSTIMAILFALIIGFTTYNFGTIARYRIILLPFYLFSLVSLYTVYKDKKRIAA